MQRGGVETGTQFEGPGFLSCVAALSVHVRRAAPLKELKNKAPARMHAGRVEQSALSNRADSPTASAEGQRGHHRMKIKRTGFTFPGTICAAAALLCSLSGCSRVAVREVKDQVVLLGFDGVDPQLAHPMDGGGKAAQHSEAQPDRVPSAPGNHRAAGIAGCVGILRHRHQSRQARDLRFPESRPEELRPRHRPGRNPEAQVPAGTPFRSRARRSRTTGKGTPFYKLARRPRASPRRS